MRTPSELIKEAIEAEEMARLVSYGKDRDWLLAKAAELRHLAERAEQIGKREGPPEPDRR